MAELHDPAQPRGAIVATHEEDPSLEEGQVRRNDGVVLNPASKNPWYVLATVAGEQNDRINPTLHAKNRRFWNGWMCQNLSHLERVDVANNFGLKHKDLVPLSEAELATLEQRFADAFPERSELRQPPKPEQSAFLSHCYFHKILAMEGFYIVADCFFNDGHLARNGYFGSTAFRRRTCFQAFHFANDADFERTRFCNVAEFQYANFGEFADFGNAHFTESAFFDDAVFASKARFDVTTFDGRANFKVVGFGKDVDFRDAIFAGDAVFKKATFDKHIDFSNGAFKSRVDFVQAKFNSRVPKFYHRDMHQDTRFSDQPKFWPDVTSDNAEPGKKAYTRLRQIAAEVYDPDLEHFFLRQEMRCKERIEQDKGAWFHAWFFAAYRVIADSGISVARPSFALALLVAVPWGIIGSWLNENGSETPIAEGFGVSLGNTLPFLGLVRKMHPDFYKEAPWWLDALSGAQSLIGIVLLFFLGLGLRNRFRLK